ncbi:MAG: hypothetical protein ACYDEA_04810 [Candidatus Dormibacteria bacterium]
MLADHELRAVAVAAECSVCGHTELYWIRRCLDSLPPVDLDAELAALAEPARRPGPAR